MNVQSSVGREGWLGARAFGWNLSPDFANLAHQPLDGVLPKGSFVDRDELRLNVIPRARRDDRATITGDNDSERANESLVTSLRRPESRTKINRTRVHTFRRFPRERGRGERSVDQAVAIKKRIGQVVTIRPKSPGKPSIKFLRVALEVLEEQGSANLVPILPRGATAGRF